MTPWLGWNGSCLMRPTDTVLSGGTILHDEVAYDDIAESSVPVISTQRYHAEAGGDPTSSFHIVIDVELLDCQILAHNIIFDALDMPKAIIHHYPASNMNLLNSLELLTQSTLIT